MGERMNDLRIVLRCDAGPDIGLGHVKRCLALAGWLTEKPVFALADTPQAVHDEIAAAGYATIALAGSFEERAKILVNLSPDAIVYDIAHTRSRLAPNKIAEEAAALAADVPLIFLDGVNTDKLLDSELAERFALCVRPYPRASAEAKGRWLTGAEYFIVSPELSRAARETRETGGQASRILVTTGGADVGALGPRTLRELSALADRRFEIRVIVGPLVPEAIRLATREAGAASPHRVEIYEDRNDLLEDMRWCDIAVATTGLTKYELALNAVPSILISPDTHHEMNNRSFRDCDTAVDLGVAAQLPSGAIADACLRLSGDQAMRRRLSERGRALIDGNGAMRLLIIIKSLADARE